MRLPIFMGLLVLLGLVAAISSLPPAIYRFPMAGGEFLLAGTFGELRSNHFHSGIDIKTNGGIGQPLLAVRDGYVYRIKVSPYGFGKAIYLRHADGEFSVYGHMDGFTPAIEEFVYQKQYASKQYEQELYLDEGQMPVHQGELIGYSGNSGFSHGPHLHFEIRDPDEHIMNPLQYYQAFVSDHKKPELKGLAFEPITSASRANGRFEKLELKPEGSNGDYHVVDVVRLEGPVGLEYDAFDQLDGAANSCGINYARLYLDQQLIYEFALDKFSFDDKRYINLHFDYQNFKETGRRYQRSYIEPGNQLPCFPKRELSGLIVLQDDQVHALRLELADGYRNTTTVRINVQRGGAAPLPESLVGGQGQSLRASTRRNVCTLRLSNPVSRQLTGLELGYLDGSTTKLLPSYLQGEDLVYLLDLNQPEVPLYVRDPIAGHKVDFYIRQIVAAAKDNLVTEGEVQVFLPTGCVFDSLPLHIKRRPGGSQAYSDQYEIGQPDQPVFKSFVMHFDPSRAGDASHMVVARKQGGTWVYVGKETQEEGSIQASAADFGTFCVMADSVIPTIKPLNFKDGASIAAGQNTLTLSLTDAFSGINSQKILCTIDGKWELFAFDAKSGSISHRIRVRPGGQRHVLQVMAFDNANNLAQATFTITY